MGRTVQGDAPTTTLRIGSRYDQTVPAWTLTERILLALRAGPMDSAQIEARWGFENVGTILGKLVCARYVSRTGTGAGTSVYRLTAAGRAVCPCRNPAAGPQKEAA